MGSQRTKGSQSTFQFKHTRSWCLWNSSTSTISIVVRGSQSTYDLWHGPTSWLDNDVLSLRAVTVEFIRVSRCTEVCDWSVTETGWWNIIPISRVFSNTVTHDPPSASESNSISIWDGIMSLQQSIGGGSTSDRVSRSMGISWSDFLRNSIFLFSSKTEKVWNRSLLFWPVNECEIYHHSFEPTRTQ